MADGVGAFAEHGVVEEPVAGLGVVAASVEPWVVGVVGWDRSEVFLAVEPGQDVGGGLVQPEADGSARLDAAVGSAPNRLRELSARGVSVDVDAVEE